jgi:hypothetical protein
MIQTLNVQVVNTPVIIVQTLRQNVPNVLPGLREVLIYLIVNVTMVGIILVPMLTALNVLTLVPSVRILIVIVQNVLLDPMPKISQTVLVLLDFTRMQANFVSLVLKDVQLVLMLTPVQHVQQAQEETL